MKTLFRNGIYFRNEIGNETRFRNENGTRNGNGNGNELGNETRNEPQNLYTLPHHPPNPPQQPKPPNPYIFIKP